MPSRNDYESAVQWIAQTVRSGDTASPLGRPARLAVVGLSNNRQRPSHQVSQALQQIGLHIVPVNPNVDSVLGEPAYDNLARVPAPVDVVQVFRQPQHVPLIAAETIAEAQRLGVRIFWLQEDVHHAEATQRVMQAGIRVVEDRCLWKEIKQYIT